MQWAWLVREAFALTRRGTALWRLGMVSAVQVALYTILLCVAVLPLTALTQILAMSESPGALPAGMVEAVPQALDWVTANRFGIVLGVLFLFTLWGASGVFDVAATAGSISQTGRLADGRTASFTQGMRDGFRAWWRTVGLFAIAAIPALISLFVLAVVTLVTITIPISQGQTPSPAAISLGGAVNSLLSSILGLVSVPLGVLAQLGMRHVVFEDAGWKSAWRSAVELARSRLTDVVLAYLVLLAVVSLCASAVALVAGGLTAALVVSVTLLVGAAHTFSGAAFFVTALGSLVLLVIGVGSFVFLVVWQSVAWTLFWRRVRGPSPAHTKDGAGVPHGVAGPSI